jgi:hypothetical protein
MDLTAIVERMNARMPKARRVKYAASLPIAREDIAKSGVGDAWLYVIPGSESGIESDVATDGEDEEAVDQFIRVEFQIWYFIRNVSMKLGADLQDKLEPIRKECRDAILGFVPQGAEMPIQFARGAPQGFTESLSAYADTFSTATRYIAQGTYSN